jgi:hypothetical protein
MAACRGDDRGGSSAAVPGAQASGTPTIHTLRPALEPVVITLVTAYEDAEAGSGLGVAAASPAKKVMALLQSARAILPMAGPSGRVPTASSDPHRHRRAREQPRAGCGR